MAQKYKSIPKHAVGSNAQVNLTDQEFCCYDNWNQNGWWIDIVSSRHVCYDLEILKIYMNKKMM